MSNLDKFMRIFGHSVIHFLELTSNFLYGMGMK